MLTLNHLLLAILLVNIPSSGSALCLKDQQSLLLKLKNGLVSNPSSSIDWNSTTDCCSWIGVTCDDDGLVIGLDLSDQGISGGIDNSSSLFDLQYLQTLNLAYNNFELVNIPTRIGKLGNLTHLNLSFAGFGGEIPMEISGLKRLVSLDLSLLFQLQLGDASLLKLVQNLTELKELRLDRVLISASGKDWGHALSSSLPKLTVLSMSVCNLSGPIDTSIAKLSSLSIIDLSGNKLSAPIPDFFDIFSNLTYLNLGSSELVGSLPAYIVKIPTLQFLDLSSNKMLQGSLSDFAQNGSLRYLGLLETSISGQLPNSIGHLKMLSSIYISNSKFSGPVPSTISKLTELVSLDFSGNQFNGALPTLEMSKKLISISMSRNKFTGQIPSQWEGHRKLVDLSIGHNMISGRIPSFLFSHPSLKTISLENNLLSGHLDVQSIAPSPRLKMLDLSSNNLSGPIPISLYELKGLSVLELSGNKFNGTMQLRWMQKLENLTGLGLSYNNLSVDATGIPQQLTTLKLASCKLYMFPDLTNQSRLGVIDLSDNQIRGRIPTWIWNSKYLSSLNLSHNLLVDLEKPYPAIISLSMLDIHSNMFNGKLPILPIHASYLDYSTNNITSIPHEIGDYLEFAVFLSLSNNELTGSIPGSICKARYLMVLDLSNNKLSGTMPQCFSELSTTLGVLNLSSNKFGGNISLKFPETCGLKTLNIKRNQLTGQVPRSLANCTKLEIFDAQSNQLSDNFPFHLKTISTLQVLVLRSNNFHGSLICPENKCLWPRLRIIDIASNNFSGKIPQDFFGTWQETTDDKYHYMRFDFLQLNGFYYQDTVAVTTKGLEMEMIKVLTVFSLIDFSNNHLIGSIPKTIGEFKSLYGLNLSQNDLTGSVPSVIGNLKHLESLDLSRNNLSGEIPLQLTELNFLSLLNLSNNQLDGKIPKGAQFQTFTEASFRDNKGLCGPPLKDCRVIENTPIAQDAQHVHSWNGIQWNFLSIELGLLFGLLVIVGPLICSKRWRIWYYGQTDWVLFKLIPRLDEKQKHQTMQKHNNRRRHQRMRS